jgi:hypothetical protein
MRLRQLSVGALQSGTKLEGGCDFSIFLRSLPRTVHRQLPRAFLKHA